MTARILLAWAALLLPAPGPVDHGTSPGDILPPLPEGRSWRLIWHDEFDGESLDLTKWTPLGDGKRRDGYWDNTDVLVEDGRLRLRVRQQGRRVTSGAISTDGKFEHAFGYYVALCRMPVQPGHWPAFWLMSHGAWSRKHTDGSGGAEIDVVEMPWRRDRVSLNIHWGGYVPSPTSFGETAAIPGGIESIRDYHAYGLHWSPDEYVFYIDGVEVWRTTGGGVSQVPEYINITEEVGTCAGDIRSASLPDTFEVDYVRVYDIAPADSVGPGTGGR